MAIFTLVISIKLFLHCHCKMNLPQYIVADTKKFRKSRVASSQSHLTTISWIDFNNRAKSKTNKIPANFQ